MDEERSEDTPEVEETFADEEATPAAGTGEPGGASEEALDEEGSEDRGDE
jgi:hypothetical protein